MEDPGRSRDVIEDDIGHLHHQPRYDDIGNAYLEYISAFEFVE